jgi:hypothetical protein
VDAQLVTQDVEKGRSVVGHLDVGAVDTELDQGRSWIRVQRLS